MLKLETEFLAHRLSLAYVNNTVGALGYRALLRRDVERPLDTR